MATERKLLLKHIFPNELPNQKFYFYEGEADVHYGVIELPADPRFEHWALRAWMKGYRLDPVTGQEISRDRLSALLMQTSTLSAVSAEQESADESVDRGGQPARANRVRSSK